MTNTTEDLLFFKLKDLITEQSEGEWTDAMIVKDAHHFANNLRPMLAASPQGEGSSADWIKHDGGPNPVPGQMVDVTLRSSDVLGNQHADDESWMHIWGQADIIAYRVTEGVKP